LRKWLKKMKEKRPFTSPQRRIRMKKKKNLVILLLLLLSLLTASLAAAQGERGKIVVANRASGTISVISTQKLPDVYRYQYPSL